MIFSGIMNSLKAQCTTTIATFPYQQDFETSNGGWTPGGTNSDWAWGTPLKPVINGAGSGTKCWVTGTLTQSYYTSNQNSTLTSPCFDFSGMTAPYLRFKIFWETERKYDGASLQYSIDGGATWTTLGSNQDFVSCPSSNWFNTTTITTLGSDGWSGNIQPTAACAGGAGNGSGTWKTAEHELFSLAGKTNVRFRFRFASGSVCNGYDGFAIDDIWIGQATASVPTFTYQCSGSNTVNFSSAFSGCGSTYLWNFGDPASGTTNTSTLSQPVHNFSGAGQYQVSLTVQNSTIPPATVIKTIHIIEPTLTLTNSISCNGAKDGSVAAQVLPAGNYTYSWNTVPAQNGPNATGLGAGSYTLTVSGNDVCTASDFITLTEPIKLTHQQSFTDPLCGGANGKIELIPSGGTTPYQFNWNPNVSSSATASNLLPGAYRIQILDARGCRDSSLVQLANRNNLQVFLGNDTTICNGQQLLLAPLGSGSFLWQDRSTQTTYTVTQSGVYSVELTDNNGCKASDTVKVTVDCSDIYFPSAITPNGDGKNDSFGALGNLGSVQQYRLSVYNRWGQLVFSTSTPSLRWSGRLGATSAGNGTFVWRAEYKLAGRAEKVLRKGTFTIIL